MNQSIAERLLRVYILGNLRSIELLSDRTSLLLGALGETQSLRRKLSCQMKITRN